MTFEFSQALPLNYTGSPIIISGENPSDWSGLEYLIIKNGVGENTFVGAIRHRAHGLPFKEAILQGNLLAVGHQDYFYLYDIDKNRNLCSLEASGYFGHLHFDEGLFYVTSAWDIYCINKIGNVIWKGDIPSVDGTLINRFEGGKIYLSCQTDPPEVWEEVVLDKATGKRLG